MARKYFDNIWSYILSSFAIVGFISHPAESKETESQNIDIDQSATTLKLRVSKQPKLVLKQTTVQGQQLIQLAGHGSHSSHASHASHASHSSHYSSSGSTSYPTYNPPPVVVPAPQKTKKEEPPQAFPPLKEYKTPLKPSPEKNKFKEFSNIYEYVLNPKIKVREGPGIEYPIVMSIDKNKKVLIIEEKNSWKKILISEGNEKYKSGWVLKESVGKKTE